MSAKPPYCQGVLAGSDCGVLRWRRLSRRYADDRQQKEGHAEDHSLTSALSTVSKPRPFEPQEEIGPRAKPLGGSCGGTIEEVRLWRYRLTVRTEPSQGSNTGSIPVSATKFS